MNKKHLRVGIYGISGQSGKAYLADLLDTPDVQVYGYARPSQNGREVVDAILRQGGLEMQRPPNLIEDTSRFISLTDNAVGHDLERLIEDSDVIIFTHPSVYHEETALSMASGLRARRVPLVLSPSRTLATPYLWQILGEQYPIITLQTCPYACKSYSPGSTYIKRRKKNWIASIEGEVPMVVQFGLKKIFPQIVYSTVPATTSLGNIGAVFHPIAYVLNLPTIREYAARGEHYSFYVQGIANNPEVGRIVGEVDQIRLQIAKAVGCKVIGLDGDDASGEEAFVKVLERLAELDRSTDLPLRELRYQRAVQLREISETVTSAQLWLAYTYGVTRISGESLANAIGRTPHFQERSYPQQRYADEDIPTGLVPLESLAKRLGIDHAPLTRVIDTYNALSGQDLRQVGRNLEGFETDDLLRYLRGEHAVSSLERSA